MRTRLNDSLIAMVCSVIFLAGIFVGSRIFVGSQRDSNPTAHPGLDACVMEDTTRMVPEAWLLETRAQRDSLDDELRRWKDLYVYDLGIREIH